MSNEKYALIKNGIVVDIILFDNPSEELLSFFKNEKEVDSIVLATEKTTIDGEYDGNMFWTIKPFTTWIKDLNTNSWIPPIPYPALDELNPKTYFWSEEHQQWIENLPLENI